MEKSKKDPSLRVAANDPHLVSLGGGRLSTAVTIHNIPIGDCTIGSSPHCSVSLSGAGVRPMHCTIYRSEENKVTLVPERDARLLIDGQLIKHYVNLRQGAMITIGDSYYLRYNNPAEALEMRSAIGHTFGNEYLCDLDNFYESNINPALEFHNCDKIYNDYDNLKKSQTSKDFAEWKCPKVFTADLVTVSMPAKDVLGQKYASFAKNLAENHRKNKNINVNNTSDHIYKNILINSNLSESKRFLYDVSSSSTHRLSNDIQQCELKQKEKEPLEDMLNMSAEYTDRQNRCTAGSGSESITSSPIVQNRIKTNGSLPRDKKSLFHQELQNSCENNSNPNRSTTSYGMSSSYENVQLLQDRVEVTPARSFSYENNKMVPQSPRNKIRTNCISPQNENQFENLLFNQNSNISENSQTNYGGLINLYEDKFQKEIEAVKKSSRFPNNTKMPKNLSPITTKKINKNNNHTIDIKSFVSPHNSPKPLKRHTPDPINIAETKTFGTGSLTNLCSHQTSHENLQKQREDLLQRIQSLKKELSLLQKQEDEVLVMLDMENALIIAKLQFLAARKQRLQEKYKLLEQKKHKLEAQRNATRVFEENQQSKLKHSIEMKQDQVKTLKDLLRLKPDNLFLKEELSNVKKSIENDKILFEDLEFQYLEGESEWQAHREDLVSEEQFINKKIEECEKNIANLKNQESSSVNRNDDKQRRLNNHLISLIKDLYQCEEQFQQLEKELYLKINPNRSLLKQKEDRHDDFVGYQSQMTQSLNCSTEILCPKTCTEDLMSKSVNENMFYENKTELPQKFLANNRAKNSKDDVGIKETNYKIDTIKEIEKQLHLLFTRRGQRDLNYERQKIEEFLRKLNTGTKQKTAREIKNFKTFKKNNFNSLEKKESEKLIHSQMQRLPRSEPSNSVYANTPLLFTKIFNFCNNINHKNINELSVSSPDSPRSFNLDDKHSSSVLSNELSLQGDNCRILFDRKKIQQKQQRPLTRYLPIFAENLDLKCHIESAGHPISLCPHVFLDSFSCRGYLHKLGSKFHAWSKRWFVLDRHRTAFIYYADKSERKPRGGAYFFSIDEVYLDHLNISKSSRPHSTFIVKTKERSYYLQAASDTAARIWIDAIITGAQGNMDY